MQRVSRVHPRHTPSPLRAPLDVAAHSATVPVALRRRKAPLRPETFFCLCLGVDGATSMRRGVRSRGIHRGLRWAPEGTACAHARGHASLRRQRGRPRLRLGKFCAVGALAQKADPLCGRKEIKKVVDVL